MVRRRDTDDFAAEIESHLTFEAERLEAEGVSANEARAAAHRAFGNVTLATERYYEGHRWAWWDRLRQDLRHAVRMWRRSPGFTAIAILTMALGIGATTAVFSVVDATLLHPLPYPRAQELVSVVDDLPGIGSYDVGLSQPEWLDVQRSGIFDNVAPAWFDENNLTGASRPAQVRLMSVTPNYFAVLGVAPQLGRTFPADDRSPGYLLEIVISDGLWKRDFGGDRRVVDRSIRLDTDLYRVVGVMPPAFHAPGRTVDERNVDVWAATNFYGPPLPYNPSRRGRNLPVVGDVRRSLIMMLGAVGLVLLTGCVNVANLFLARARARRREFAVRQAIGAGPGRLRGQLLTESLCLSATGGAVGILILSIARATLMRLIPAGLPRLNDITFNWVVLLFAAGVTLLSGVIFGLAPAMDAGRRDLARPRRARASRTLVIVEMTLSVVLMAAAGLLLRSFHDLLSAPLGFNPDSVTTVRTRLPYPNDTSVDKYRTIDQEAPFLREVLGRVRRLSGVEEAALGSSSAIPLDHAHRDMNVMPLLIQGRGIDATQAPLVDGSVVTPEYFPLLRMTLLRGRLFTNFDLESKPAVAVVNDAMARAFWPNADPIGARVKLSSSATAWTTIVGVVADARTETLTGEDVPQIYACAYQKPAKHLAIFLRGPRDTSSTAEGVRAAVQSVDPSLPVFGAALLTDTVSASLDARRFATEMVGVFALTALMLAALGIYGVVSYAVVERTQEIGIRIVLGARQHTIMRLIVGHGLTLTTIGALAGLVFAAIVARLMAVAMPGIRQSDPVMFTAVAATLIAVACCACYIPARRALRIDPIAASKGDAR